MSRNYKTVNLKRSLWSDIERLGTRVSKFWGIEPMGVATTIQYLTIRCHEMLDGLEAGKKDPYVLRGPVSNSIESDVEPFAVKSSDRKYLTELANKVSEDLGVELTDQELVNYLVCRANQRRDLRAKGKNYDDYNAQSMRIATLHNIGISTERIGQMKPDPKVSA